MSFWTDTEKPVEPKRTYRFRLSSDGDIGLGATEKSYWWNIKKVDKPSFNVSSNKYRLINHEINIPGIAVWNPINIEMVDVGEQVDALLKHLGASGYNPRNLSEDSGIAKSHSGLLLNLTIEQLNGAGETLDSWLLEGAFITDVKFGNLDYSSDEFVMVTLTIAYDYAYLSTSSTGDSTTVGVVVTD